MMQRIRLTVREVEIDQQLFILLFYFILFYLLFYFFIYTYVWLNAFVCVAMRVSIYIYIFFSLLLVLNLLGNCFEGYLRVCDGGILSLGETIMVFLMI